MSYIEIPRTAAGRKCGATVLRVVLIYFSTKARYYQICRTKSALKDTKKQKKKANS